MEYRIKYRDIPWPVAIGVLPGKIIGTFLIKPWFRLKRNWKSIAIRWLNRLLFLAVMTVVLFFIVMVVESTTEGGLSKTYLDFWNWWTATTPEPAIVESVKIIGNVH